MKKRMKNIKNRHGAKTERIRLLFKALASNEFLPKDVRSKSFLKLQTLNGKPSKIRNRCIVTSRGRGIVGVFKLSNDARPSEERARRRRRRGIGGGDAARRDQGSKPATHHHREGHGAEVWIGGKRRRGARTGPRARLSGVKP